MEDIDAVARRFWSKVAVGAPGECSLWQGALSPKGYGRFTMNGRTHQAHRVALMLIGVDIGGLSVRHRCDSPGCQDVQHLELGEPADNSRDMVERGRSRRGSKHYRARLTEELVYELRCRRAAGERVMDLAVEVGVNRKHLSEVLIGGKWSHVRMPSASTRHVRGRPGNVLAKARGPG